MSVVMGKLPTRPASSLDRRVRSYAFNKSPNPVRHTQRKATGGRAVDLPHQFSLVPSSIHSNLPNTSSLPILHTQHHHHGSRLSPHQLPGLCQVAARHPAIHAQTSRRILQLSPGIETQGYPGVPQAGELQHARTPITFIIQILILFSRYYSANYAVVVALLAVYSLISNPLLLLSLGFLIGGFLAISRFGTSSFQIVVSSAAGFACSSLGTDYQLTIYWQSRSPSRSPAKSSPLGTSTSLSSSSVSVLGLFPIFMLIDVQACRSYGSPPLSPPSFGSSDPPAASSALMRG